MIANQTLVANDGNEVALFPMPYMYITQDEEGSYSHSGTYNIDFVGWNGSTQVYKAPLYAPCTMKVIEYLPTYNGGNAVIFQSMGRVHFADGTLDYMTLMFMHCDEPPYTNVGDIVRQGELCYRTGTYGNVTGDHVHSCLGRGQGGTFVQRPSGNYDLSNRIHYYNGVYVNDTTIVQGAGHDWKTWRETPITTEKKRRFPYPIAWTHWSNFKI